MLKEIKFLKKEDVDNKLSQFLAVLEEHFFSLALEYEEDIPDYLRNITHTYERIQKRIDRCKTYKILYDCD